jgi:hypothetical protein
MESLANGIFKEIENFHFVQMGIDQNYVPTKFQVGALPTIYFVKQTYKPMIYVEKQTEENILDFLGRYSDVYKAYITEKSQKYSQKEDL